MERPVMSRKKGFSFRSVMNFAYRDDDKEITASSPEGIVRVANKIGSAFPGSLTSHTLAKEVEKSLKARGYEKETALLATSLCCDEVNRDLEDDLRDKFGSNFTMGGLAGFPFAGMTSFGAMAHHIPTGGSCLVVYGPHVGIDVDGNVGKVNRRGRSGPGACCGSANAALAYVKMVRSGERAEADIPDDFIDSQQVWIHKTLLQHGERLTQAEDEDIELPHALFDIQDDYMKRIVEKASREVAGDGKIALLGGIQINTPGGTHEYFLPKKFQLLDRNGELIEDLLDELVVPKRPQDP